LIEFLLVLTMNLNIIEKLKNYIRVLKLNKTPTKEKFFETLKICVLGVIIIGIIGFVFYIISMVLGL